MPSIPLSKAKAQLSEVIRKIRETGESMTITVDGAAAAELRPVQTYRESLDEGDARAIHRLALLIREMGVDSTEFDAVELVKDGRR